MPFISSKSRSNYCGTKDDIRPVETFQSIPYETFCDKLRSDYNVVSIPTLDSANGTSHESLLVEIGHGLLNLSQLPEFDTTGLGLSTERTDPAVLIHRHYCAFQPPPSVPNSEWTWKKATIEIVAIRKAFPIIKDTEDTLLAMTAWFHFLCNIDDEIERMGSFEGVLVLERIIEALKATSLERLHLAEDVKPVRSVTDIFKRVSMGFYRKIPLTTHRSVSSQLASTSNTSGQENLIINNLAENSHVKVLALASNFIRQCQVVLSAQTLPKVFAEAINCLEAMKEESVYRKNTPPPSVEDYLRLRIRTVGLSPFFSILENTLVGIEAQKAEEFKAASDNDLKYLRDDGRAGSESSDSSSFWNSTLHKSLCDSVKLIVGLQNDIVGLNRDIEKGERLNLALLLLEHRNETTENPQAINEARATAVSMHNAEMQIVMRTWAGIEAAKYSPAVQLYAQSLVALIRTIYTWATHSDRYKSKHPTISEIFSSAAQNTAVEGLRFKARAIRTRRSLQKLVASHTR